MSVLFSNFVCSFGAAGLCRLHLRKKQVYNNKCIKYNGKRFERTDFS